MSLYGKIAENVGVYHSELSHMSEQLREPLLQLVLQLRQTLVKTTQSENLLQVLLVHHILENVERVGLQFQSRKNINDRPSHEVHSLGIGSSPLLGHVS